jgi:hypothetical protein
MYCLKLTGKDWTSKGGGAIMLLKGLLFASLRLKDVKENVFLYIKFISKNRYPTKSDTQTEQNT